MVEGSSKTAPESKRINFSIIILGTILVFVGQTWISVLNAQQAYGMNEARIAEAKVERVADRLEEIANFFRSPELVYFYAMNEGYQIVLTPDSLQSEDNKQVWGYSNEVLVEDKYAEATSFVDNVDSMLPERNKKFFTPFSESVQGTPLGNVLALIESGSPFFDGFRRDGFNITWDNILFWDNDVNVAPLDGENISEDEQVSADSVEITIPVPPQNVMPEKNEDGLVWDEVTNSYRIPSPITR